jgi:tRNA(fMet)-specific endonuclease VapC
MYLLDTNACIRILNGTSDILAERLRRHSAADIRLCSIVKAELLYGARHSQRIADNLRLLARFFNAFVSIPFDDLAAEQYGIIRDQLARNGSPIGPNDLMIAAVAVAHRLTLVTNNINELSRVVGLAIEDWEAEP